MSFIYPKVSSRYGAPMGRRNVLPDGPAKLHLERVRMVDGDYDPGGAYWGGGLGTEPLYVAWDENGTQLFVRAGNREEAKQRILDDAADEITFHRAPADAGHHSDTF